MNFFRKIFAKLSSNKYYSQAGQDKWVAEFFNSKRNGYFLDIGAFDGVYYSNSYYLEKKLGWTGLLIEADPIYYKKLLKCRTAKSINIAVSDKVGESLFLSSSVSGKIDEKGDVTVKTDTLVNIFKQNNVPNVIDYMSLDIEGAEYTALLAFPFKEYKTILLTVEHNAYLGSTESKEKLYEILTKNNYVRVQEDVQHIGLPFEDWYVHKDFLTK